MQKARRVFGATAIFKKLTASEATKLYRKPYSPACMAADARTGACYVPWLRHGFALLALAGLPSTCRAMAATAMKAAIRCAPRRAFANRMQQKAGRKNQRLTQRVYVTRKLLPPFSGTAGPRCTCQADAPSTMAQSGNAALGHTFTFVTPIAPARTQSALGCLRRSVPVPA